MAFSISLPRNNPEAENVSSSGILSFIEAVEKDKLELHSFMLLRHGKVISEGWWSPYNSNRPHMLFSLSKSFTSTAIGLAVEEGLLSVDDTVVSFFPEDVPETVSENLAKLKVKHLLSMSTGHAEDTTGYVVNQKHGNWVKAFLELPITYEPGTHFVYNTAATYMLSAIVQKKTGKTLLEYLTPSLFEPLGIDGATWETCPRGINTGGFGLSIKTEDIAKFGQIYLQKGNWEGKQILTEKWIEEATSSHISNGTAEDSDWAQGYCYQFWRCRHNAYRGDGAFGQYCVVVPEKDMVIAITSGVNDMQAVLNHIWNHILPSVNSSAFAEDEEAKRALAEKLSSLKLNFPKHQVSSNTSERISHKLYKLEENNLGIQALSLDFNSDCCTFRVLSHNGDQELICGIENWLVGTTSIFGSPSAVAASSTWYDENTFVITCQLIETPFCYTIKFEFNEEDITTGLSTNVSFDTKELPVLHGRLA